jgi:release factor glutamine methyltransferase
MMAPNVLDFEPHAALFVEDKDPLIFYRALAKLSGALLSSQGTVWLEINENYGDEVAQLMSDSGFTQTFIHKDIHEKQRFVEARF